MNAALALVEAQEAGGGSRSHAPPGAAEADPSASLAVREAMALEAAAAGHLSAARGANRDFQRQRKAVRDLAVDAWDQLVAIAKVARGGGEL